MNADEPAWLSRVRKGSRRWLLSIMAVATLLCGAAESAAAEVAAVDDSFAVATWLAEDGLPENRVVGVAQSPDGFLWVGSQSGVVRFDGVRFRKLGFLGSPDGLPGTVRLLTSDHLGRIWFAKEGGIIACVDGARLQTWTPEQRLPKNDLQRSMAIDGEGSIWVGFGSGKVVRVNPGGDVATFTAKEGLPEGSGVCWFATDRSGTLWFAKDGCVGVFRNGRFEVLKKLGSPAIRIAAAQAGGVWICAGPQLLKLDEGAEAVKSGTIVPAKAGTASSGEPSVIFEDHAGAVWVGTASAGLFRCASGEVVQVRLPNAGILSLAEDREGNLWVGTRGGLHRVRPRPIAMVKPRDGQPLGVVQSACEDASGALWAVVENGALLRREGDDWAVQSLAGAAGREWATCVAADGSGAIWVGARGGALYRWHKGRFEDLGLRDDLRKTALRSLLVTSGNDLWIATDAPDVLFRLRGQALQSFALPRGNRFIRAMAEDAAGHIWAGASDGMLVRVAGDAVEDQTAKPTSPSIRCLHAAANGDLWIGYAGAGVGRFRDGSIVRLNTEQGMPTDYVSQILTDDRGDLWMAGNQGIFHIRERDFAAVAKGSSKRVLPMLYGRSEGISGLQATFDYYPSALLSADKKHLYFSTLTGLAEFRLENARLNHAPPRVWIERLIADHRTFAEYLGSGAASPATQPSPIELGQSGKKGVVRLPPGAQRVQFEFTALSLVAPENVQFRYQWEGLDKDWVEAGTRRFASYTQPPPGHYRFRVAACNNDGVWNETGDSLAVICEPYVWETHWFRLVAGLASLASVIGGVTLLLRRRHRRAMEALERQQTLELERARIARVMTMGELGASIAHEVNQPLAAVVTNAHACLRWLDRAAPNLQEAREAMLRIIRDGKRGSEVISRIRALLKKEQPSKERLEVNAVIRETVALAAPSLQGATVALDLADELPVVWADRVQLQQVLLNLMTNAVHAMEAVTDRPRVLRIRTRKQTDSEVLVAVEDSGIGLDGAQAEKFFESFFTTKPEGLGLGLSISRSIVEAHGGRLWASANAGAGATFQFTLTTHPPQVRPDVQP